MSEIQTNDETSYRFGHDDEVLQLLDGSVISTYRWRRASDFTIDPDVRVEIDGTSYEYVDEDTEVTAVHGTAPYGIGVGYHLIWYEETDAYTDLAIVLDPESAVLGGFVQEPDDDADDEPVAVTSYDDAGAGLATESAGRPLVPILLVLVVVVGLVAFLAVG